MLFYGHQKADLGTYWANTSSNSLIGKLVQEGSEKNKTTMEIAAAM